MARKKAPPTPREKDTKLTSSGLVSTTPSLEPTQRLGAQAVRREALMANPILQGFEDRIAMGAMGMLDDITPQERKYMTQVAADHLLGRSDEQQGIKEQGVSVTLRLNGKLYDPVSAQYLEESAEDERKQWDEIMALDAQIKAERDAEARTDD